MTDREFQFVAFDVPADTPLLVPFDAAVNLGASVGKDGLRQPILFFSPRPKRQEDISLYVSFWGATPQEISAKLGGRITGSPSEMLFKKSEQFLGFTVGTNQRSDADQEVEGKRAGGKYNLSIYLQDRKTGQPLALVGPPTASVTPQAASSPATASASSNSLSSPIDKAYLDKCKLGSIDGKLWCLLPEGVSVYALTEGRIAVSGQGQKTGSINLFPPDGSAAFFIYLLDGEVIGTSRDVHRGDTLAKIGSGTSYSGNNLVVGLGKPIPGGPGYQDIPLGKDFLDKLK